jgi:ABC-type antimicrobial peptide transport system permease subunit
LRDPSVLDGQLYVRFAGSASAMEKAIFDSVKSLDRMQVLTPQTIWEEQESRAENMRSLANIIVVMASIAVLLAVTGVYAVLSFAVTQRRREFGIRMVLGANRIRVFRSILLRGGSQIAVGLTCGLALAEPAVWAFARLIKNSPFPFRSFDASVFAIAAVLLIAVSLAGMCLPARRATQVDPMQTLRTE